VVSEDKAGMAAGLPGTIMMIGAAFGAAVVTVILSASDLPQIPGVPQAHLYTVGYAVSALFAVGILIAVAVSTRRHPGAFKALMIQG
jgi:hypothetical protein